MRSVDAGLLQNVWKNHKTRIHAVIKEIGGHFENPQVQDALREIDYTTEKSEVEYRFLVLCYWLL